MSDDGAWDGDPAFDPAYWGDEDDAHSVYRASSPQRHAATAWTVEDYNERILRAREHLRAVEEAALAKHPKRSPARDHIYAAVRNDATDEEKEEHDLAVKHRFLMYIYRETERLQKTTPAQKLAQQRGAFVRREVENLEAWRREHHPYAWDSAADAAARREAMYTEHRAERYMWRGQPARPAPARVREDGGPYWRAVALTEALLALQAVKQSGLGLAAKDRSPMKKRPADGTASLGDLYAEHVPEAAQRDLGLVLYKLLRDGPGDQERAPGGYWGWWAKEYRYAAQYAADLRAVCVQAMRFFATDEPIYARAHELLTGGAEHKTVDPPICIDRELLALTYEEWDRDKAPCGERPLVDAAELAAHVEAKDALVAGPGGDARWVGIRPALEHEMADWYVRRLIEDLADHPCSASLRRAFLRPGAVANNPALTKAYDDVLNGSDVDVDEERTTLDDIEAELEAGFYGYSNCIERIEHDLTIMFHTARLWYGSKHAEKRYAPAEGLTHAKLAHMAGACEAFFHTGFPAVVLGAAPRPRMLSRLQVISRLHLRQELPES